MRTEYDYSPRRAVTHQPLIRDYPAVLLRGKWIIIGVTLALLVATVILTKLRPATYQASSAVLIQTRVAEQGALFIPSIGSGIITNIRQNELEILRSQSLAEAVARRLIAQMYLDSLANDQITIIKPAKNEEGIRTVATVDQVVRRLATAVEFATVRESDVIKIIAKSPDPREAALLANVFTSEYYNRSVYKSRERSRALREFLQDQVTDQRAQLENIESALQTYMENKGIVSLDEESRRMIEQLSQIEATRNANDVTLATLERTLALYTAELPQQEAMLARSIGNANDPYIRSLQEQLANLEVQRDMALAKNPAIAGKEAYSDKLREITEQIKVLEGKLQARTDEYIKTLVPSSPGPDASNQPPSSYLRIVKQRILETQIEIQAARARKEAMGKVLAEYEKQFEKIPGKSIQFARLERARQGSEKLFVMLSDKLNEANIAEQSQFGHIDIIDRATVPVDPSSPNLMLNAAIALVFGTFFGIVAVIAREYRDVRIHTPEDLKVKGFSTAAVVPIMDAEIKRMEGNKVLSRYGRPLDPHLLSMADAFSPVAEAYRKLRTHVQFDRSDRRPQSILVTSPNSGEGKSTTVANLGASFAQTGLMTLIVDCNLRRPRQHAMFDVFQSPGLSELLLDKTGYENVVQLTAQRNLHILCAGAVPHNPAELLSSDRMKELMEQAKVEYDVIVLDSPPALTVADASILSTFVDCPIVVVAAGQTRTEELERTVDIIGSVSAAVPRHVLNKFDQRTAYGISYHRSGYGAYAHHTPGRAQKLQLMESSEEQ